MKDDKEVLRDMLLENPKQKGIYVIISKIYEDLISDCIEKRFDFPKIAKLIEQDLGPGIKIRSKSLFAATNKNTKRVDEIPNDSNQKEDEGEKDKDPYKGLDFNKNYETKKENMFDKR